MNRATLLAVTLVVGVATSSCGSARSATFPTPTALPTLAPLDRADYQIFSDVEGAACVRYTGLWPLPLFWTASSDGSVSLFSFETQEPARGLAYRDALQKVPNADLLLSPRVYETDSSIAIWRASTCVKIVAKPVFITRVDGQSPATSRRTDEPKNRDGESLAVVR
jgi:hypothetical protein